MYKPSRVRYLYTPIYAYRVVRDGSKQNLDDKRTVCVYYKKNLILACKSPKGSIQCETTSNFEDFSSTKFDCFGISKSNDGKFSLFPRELDNTAFLSASSHKKNVESKLSIFADENLTDFGLKIKVPECFEIIEQVLKSSTRNEIVYLDNDINKTVNLIGELLYIHDTTSEELSLSKIKDDSKDKA